MSFRRPALPALFLAAFAQAAPAVAEALSGDAIKELVEGQRIYLATPFGGEFPLHYRADGLVDGSGEALGLGRLMQPTDTGRWWIDGDRLCQQWESWYDGQVHCFVLAQTGALELRWQRNDGLDGTARIGN